MLIIEKALEARKLSYSKYSNFAVGCAIKLKSGEFILGTNIENASYGLTMCAERTALFSLISQGYKPSDIVEIAIVGDTPNPISPCGSCRQVFAEFIDFSVPIYLSNLKQEIKKTNLKELLPYSFTF
jgi:cytidine deaminase